MKKISAKSPPRLKPHIKPIPGVTTLAATLWGTPQNFRKIADLFEENDMPGLARDIRNQLLDSLEEIARERAFEQLKQKGLAE